jgi:hypothetical protein
MLGNGLAEYLTGRLVSQQIDFCWLTGLLVFWSEQSQASVQSVYVYFVSTYTGFVLTKPILLPPQCLTNALLLLLIYRAYRTYAGKIDVFSLRGPPAY